MDFNGTYFHYIKYLDPLFTVGITAVQDNAET